MLKRFLRFLGIPPRCSEWCHEWVPMQTIYRRRCFNCGVVWDYCTRSYYASVRDWLNNKPL